MSTRFFILLIFLFGFILMPSKIFACNSKSDKACCKKEITNISKNNDCCKINNYFSKDKNNFKGKCNSESCHCPHINLKIITSKLQDNLTTLFVFSDKKQKFIVIETYLSSGFFYIWTPPNIG